MQRGKDERAMEFLDAGRFMQHVYFGTIIDTFRMMTMLMPECTSAGTNVKKSIRGRSESAYQ
jgi:hypothetical protein